MAHFISLNGDLTPATDPVFGPENRAFRYGDGFFETIRVSHGKILWAQQHYQRLVNSAATLKLTLPQGFSFIIFLQGLQELYHQNHPNQEAARLRVAIFRNHGGHYRPLSQQASILIESTALAHQAFELNKKGLMIDVYPDLSKNLNFLSGIKSSNALIYVLAGIFCSSNGWDDCILLNQEGNIAEATSSNLFIIKDKELITPATDQGCVHGMMRSVILDLASQLRIKAREVILTADDLEQADECFLTNTIQGIRWVGGFRTKRYFNKTGPVFLAALNQKALQEPS
ncbi:MAG: aminotransferase class IV [Bacteroidales bacterium]